MKTRVVALPPLFLVVALGLAGCGKSSEDKAALNQVLGGGTPPTRVASVDLGILQDPAGYKPASHGALGGGGGAPAGDGGGAKGGDEAAVKQTIRSLVENLASVNPDMAPAILEAFEPTQTAALAKAGFESTLRDTIGAIDLLGKSLREKAPPEQKARLEALPGVVSQITQALSDALKIQTTDANHALAEVDVEKFTASVQTIAATLAPAEGATPPGATDPGAEPAASDNPRVMGGGRDSRREHPAEGTPAPKGDSSAAPGGDSAAGDVPGFAPADMLKMMTQAGEKPSPTKLVKVDGKWRIDIGMTVTDELADLLKEGAELVREVIVEFQGKIDAAATLDQATMQGIAMPTVMSAMGKFAGWAQRFETAAAEALNKPATGDKPAGEAAPKQPGADSSIISP